MASERSICPGTARVPLPPARSGATPKDGKKVVQALFHFIVSTFPPSTVLSSDQAHLSTTHARLARLSLRAHGVICGLILGSPVAFSAPDSDVQVGDPAQQMNVLTTQGLVEAACQTARHITRATATKDSKSVSRGEGNSQAFYIAAGAFCQSITFPAMVDK